MQIGLGNLSVVTSTEFWHQELRAGRCFQRGQNVGPTAGLSSHIQLYNPAASGKQLIAYAALVSIGGAVPLFVRTDNVARSGLLGTGVNLLSGGAAGVGQVRNEDIAAPQGTLFAVMRLPVNDARYILPTWWVELSPAQGISIVPSAVNTEVVATFWWREV